MQHQALVRTLLSLAIGAALGACSSTEEAAAPAIDVVASGNSASTATAASNSPQLEEIQVTGSRIMRRDGSVRGSAAQATRVERSAAYAPAPMYTQDAH